MRKIGAGFPNGEQRHGVRLRVQLRCVDPIAITSIFFMNVKKKEGLLPLFFIFSFSHFSYCVDFYIFNFIDQTDVYANRTNPVQFTHGKYADSEGQVPQGGQTQLQKQS